MLLVVGLLFANTLLGCGSQNELERAVLSGKVTFTGKPIADGNIRLTSVSGVPLPVSVGKIKNSKYIINIRGGVPVGEHRVMIQAIRPVPGAKPVWIEEFNSFHTPTEKYIPEKYNRRSELRIAIEPGAGEVTKDFDLQP